MGAQVAIVVPVDTAVKDFGRRESRYLVDNYVRKYCAIKNEVKMQIMIYTFIRPYSTYRWDPSLHERLLHQYLRQKTV